MSHRGTRTAAAVALALLGALCGAVAAGAKEPGTDGAQALLTEAFARRYSCAVTGVVVISTRKGEMHALQRRLHVAAKFVGGKLHTYAIFREPQYVRGMAFLGVESENPNESEQQFVYLPSMQKIRRVSGSQPTDSFLGTDLSYHDFQRQRAERYRTIREEAGVIDGEAVRSIRALPLFDAPYTTVEFRIAASDRAILGTRYFKRDQPAPYKDMRMPRSGILNQNGCSVPTVVVVDDRQRGTHTELVIAGLRTNASLDDSLFTLAALEARREIPGLQDR